MKPTYKLLIILSIIFQIQSCSKDEMETQDNSNHLELTNFSSIHIESTQHEIEILEKVNSYRISKGLKSLSTNPVVKQVSNSHTLYMIETASMSHENFNDRAKYLINTTQAVSVGENVAYGYAKAEDLVEAWIKSDSHRKTIEGHYTHFEISAVQNDKGVWYYTNIFIKK